MAVYNLTFNTGKTFAIDSVNLFEVQSRVVNYINKNEVLTSCNVLCPNGVTRSIRKTGQYHWHHNGYSFD